MIIETRFFNYKSYLTVISIFFAANFHSRHLLSRMQWQGCNERRGGLGVGDGSPQRGPGGVLVVIWGKACGIHGYSVIL